jgi:hypothetical protein
VLVAAVTAASAMAAGSPAPKTTGDIGYSAYDVQRHLTFNAIQSTKDTCGTLWNVEGSKQFTFRLNGDTTDYTHHAELTQNGQNLTGFGGYPATGPETYHWNVTSGSVNGNAFSLTWVYDDLAADAVGVVNKMDGTIAADGSISGKWTDNYQGGTREGTFTSLADTAVGTPYCGKGNLSYTDVAGNGYFVNIKAVHVVGKDAWFAGPVVDGNVGAGQWLFAKVHDGGEPAYKVDHVWGSFTDEATALAGVIAADSSPADGLFEITSGNLQVQ